MKFEPVTIAQVRASQNLAIAEIPALMRYVFVPLSWPLTVLAMRAQMSPTGATVARGLTGFLAICMIALPGTASFYAGLLLLLLSLIGDSVDGNLARIQNRASYFGKFLDGFVDIAIDVSFPLALSIHAWGAGVANPAILIVGAIGAIALSLVLTLILRSSFFAMRMEMDGVKPPLKPLESSPLNAAMSKLDSDGMNALFDVRYLGLIVALVFGSVVTYIYALSALYVLTLIVLGGIRLKRAYEQLNVGRKSRTAA